MSNRLEIIRDVIRGLRGVDGYGQGAQRAINRIEAIIEEEVNKALQEATESTQSSEVLAKDQPSGKLANNENNKGRI